MGGYKDILTISGLAYGIDIAAHKASLLNNIPTVGVMASGQDIIYPAVHRETAKKMIEAGGILTEYPFGTKPDAPRFPARNRIIAGMSDATLVIEAAATGGALITAEIANSYNKEVFALPGNVNNKYSEGCNKLIRDHKANIFTNLKDLEYILGWNTQSLLLKPVKDYSFLDSESQLLIAALQKQESVQLDELSWQIQIPLSRLASLLLNLEFDGMVKSLPGKKYKLIQV